MPSSTILNVIDTFIDSNAANENVKALKHLLNEFIKPNIVIQNTSSISSFISFIIILIEKKDANSLLFLQVDAILSEINKLLKKEKVLTFEMYNTLLNIYKYATLFQVQKQNKML